MPTRWSRLLQADVAKEERQRAKWARIFHKETVREEQRRFAMHTQSSYQARERNTKTYFWVRISSGGVGVFHVKGGQKVRYVPRNPGKPKFLAGISWDFHRDIPGAPEEFEKKESVLDSCLLS